MNITTNQRLLSLKVADLVNRADLETIARMGIAIKMELRPNFRFDFSNKGAFNEVVEAMKRAGKNDKNIKTIIAYADKEPAGFLKYFLNDYRKIADYRLLFVYPKFRKLGVGCALLGAGEKDARKKGYDLIQTCASANVQPFYQKNGFDKMGINTWGERMILKLK